MAFALCVFLVSASLHTVAEAEQPCVHPHPCGDEWPDGLDGPFGLKDVRYLRLEVPADWDQPDGMSIELEGWIGLPDVPDGVKVPVALHSTPYIGECPFVPYLVPECDPTPDEPTWWTDPADPWAEHAWGVAPIELVRRGFAAAFFSVRGTGTSGGCLDEFGRNEQRDQAFLVDWLSGTEADGTRSPAAEWSNGRVAMGGISYPGTTPWEAAVQAPEGLKTIVTAGIVSDAYTFAHTPQGAHLASGGAFWTMWATSMSLFPALGNPRIARHVDVRAERVCEELVDTFTAYTAAPVQDERDATFYDERRLIDRFGEVSAAVLLAQGFDDNRGHVYQESAVWNALAQAPKRQIEGQWGHNFPVEGVATLDPSWAHDTWGDLLLSWLDYWLKGVGPVPEGLGRVDYEDTSGVWRESASWPPAEVREEVLHLRGDRLSPAPGAGSRSFRAAPSPANEYAGAEAVGWPVPVWPALCAPGVSDPVGLAYRSEPVTNDSVLAGNPFAYLELTSDQPGGIVGVHLLALAPGFDCTDPADVAVVGFGAADLRFHSGTMSAVPFPVDEPTRVRVDVWNDAHHLPSGTRLAVVVSYGEGVPIGYGTLTQPFTPQIEVLGSSEVVVPLVEGSLGGHAPSHDYPPRPFVGA